jgi:hypothetical protein
VFLIRVHRSNLAHLNAWVSIRKRVSIDPRKGQLNIFTIGISPSRLSLGIKNAIVGEAVENRLSIAGSLLKRILPTEPKSQYWRSMAYEPEWERFLTKRE